MGVGWNVVVGRWELDCGGGWLVVGEEDCALGAGAAGSISHLPEVRQTR